MDLKDFKTYGLAVAHYRICEKIQMQRFLRDQLMRAASSVVLNTAEASGKPTEKDQKKYFAIALGSLRECTAVLDLLNQEQPQARDLGNQLGACLYVLCHRPKRVI